MYNKLRIVQIAAVVIPVLGLVIATVVAWPYMEETKVSPWWWQIMLGGMLIGITISLAIQCWISESGDCLVLSLALATAAGIPIYTGVMIGPLATHIVVIMGGYMLIMTIVIVGAMLLAMKRPVAIPKHNGG